MLSDRRLQDGRVANSDPVSVRGPGGRDERVGGDESRLKTEGGERSGAAAAGPTSDSVACTLTGR